MSARRVIVIGAGLSGLACALELVRRGVDVLVLEAGTRAGGVVGTFEVDGFRFELGPNTVQASSVELRTLCGELGIAERLIATSESADERYLLHEGKLVTLPSSPGALTKSPLLSMRDKLFLASEPMRAWHAPPDGAQEPDLEQFLTERVGARAARLFGGAFVRGVYAAELSELGARSAFPRVWERLVEHKSIVRALWAQREARPPDLPGPKVARTALLSFPNGLQELVDAATHALGARLTTHCAVTRFARSAGAYRVSTSTGASFEASEIVLALPAPVAAQLLAPLLEAAVGAPAAAHTSHASAHAGRAPAQAGQATARAGHTAAGTARDALDILRAITHARVTLVHLGFDAAELPTFPRGFGYLVPPPDAGDESAQPLVLGTIFTSNLFDGRAPRGCVAVSSFYKGADVETLDEDELIEQAAGELARALGSNQTPRVRAAATRSWNDVIPRYAPGHSDRIDALERVLQAQLPGIALAGSYTGGVSVENVIARGRKIARAIAGDTARSEARQ